MKKLIMLLGILLFLGIGVHSIMHTKQQKSEKSTVTFQNHSISINQLKQFMMEVYSFEWVKQIGLRTPLVHFWSKNAYKMLNTLYPGRYKREMLISLKPMK